MKRILLLLSATALVTVFGLWNFVLSSGDTDHDSGEHAHEHGSAQTEHTDDHSDAAVHDHGDGDAHDSEAPTATITQWSEQMGLFVEHPLLVINQPGRFLVHLTLLDRFRPIREGALKLTFDHESGKSYHVVEGELLRDGIFAPTVKLPQAGKYSFTLTYSGEQVRDSFLVNDFIVYGSASEIPASEKNSDEEISFLLEQQWKIDFETGLAQVRPIRSSIRALAKVMPHMHKFAEIVSPVDGILRVDSDGALVHPGSAVNSGQILATIASPLRGVDGWTELKLSFEQAARDYQRAKRLIEQEAISQREFEAIERDYLVQKAGYDAYAHSGGHEALQLKSPIKGSVIDMNLLAGQKVSAGQKLMSIVDLSHVWLQINVYERDYYQMGNPVGVYIEIPGYDKPIIIGGDDLELISIGDAIDPVSRTIPVIVEVKNPDHLLKINQSVPVELYTGNGVSSVSVPKSAIYDDESQNVVFVVVSGESFAKAVVEVGPHQDGYVSILSGLDEGERVVTTGGYQVKLASTTAAIGHGHAH